MPGRIKLLHLLQNINRITYGIRILYFVLIRHAMAAYFFANVPSVESTAKSSSFAISSNAAVRFFLFMFYTTVRSPGFEPG